MINRSFLFAAIAVGLSFNSCEDDEPEPVTNMIDCFTCTGTKYYYYSNSIKQDTVIDVCEDSFFDEQYYEGIGYSCTKVYQKEDE